MAYDLAELERLLGDPIVDRNGVAQRALAALPEFIANLRQAWRLAVAVSRDKGAAPETRTAARSLRFTLDKRNVAPRDGTGR
jgi:hypothetical protein